MERTKLFATFRSKAEEIAEKSFTNVTEETVIANMGVDSLAMLELVGEMERELNVRIPDDRLVGIQTVRQLLDVIESRTAAAA